MSPLQAVPALYKVRAEDDDYSLPPPPPIQVKIERSALEQLEHERAVREDAERKRVTFDVDAKMEPQGECASCVCVFFPLCFLTFGGGGAK